MSLGLVAIVGSPSVGKSTIFNRIIGEKKSIIEETRGVTRDRIYAHTSWLTKYFDIVDTGGIELENSTFQSQIRMQVEIAINEADVILFVVDGKLGLNDDDYLVAKMLYKCNKPVILAVNKIDDTHLINNIYEFYSLGLGEPIPCSGAHGVGIGEILDKILEYLNKNEEKQSQLTGLRFSIIGRPNVGKSSLCNAILNENRVIVKLGLKLVEQTRNLGLREILQSCGYSKINSTTISFGVAPRINACGRMGHQEEALNLLLSKNIDEVKELTLKLNEYNKTRQDIEKNIYQEAVEKIEKGNLANNSTIVVYGDGWHHGVIGIVSSKITELYFKPSILLSEEDGEYKGSGRSINGFDLHEALMECSPTIKRFGGHAMAVGITIEKDKIEQFKEMFEKIAKEKNVDKIIPIINVDAEIRLDDINKDMVENLKELEPYGEANKMPVFAFKNLKIESIRSLTNGKNLKLSVRDNKNIVNAIGFNLGELSEIYKIGDKVDIAGNLEINSFNGVDSIQINIKDIMKSI